MPTSICAFIWRILFTVSLRDAARQLQSLAASRREHNRSLPYKERYARAGDRDLDNMLLLAESQSRRYPKTDQYWNCLGAVILWNTPHWARCLRTGEYELREWFPSGSALLGGARYIYNFAWNDIDYDCIRVSRKDLKKLLQDICA